MMGFSCMKAVYEHTLYQPRSQNLLPRSQDLFPPRPQAREKVLGTRLTLYLPGREKYYYCARHSDVSPTRKSASRLEEYVIKK